MKFKKVNEESISNTCFSQITFEASTDRIIEVFGEPSYRGSAFKTTREWWIETENGDVFTIYDWKEYRDFDDDETIEWHVGTKYGIPDYAETLKRVRNALKEFGLL